MTDITIKEIYEEILKNRKEIKNKIEATEATLLLKVAELTNKIKEVEVENVLLKEELEYLRRKNKKNSIIIFGLKQQRNEKINSEYICNKLKDLINVNIHEADLNNFYPLGNNTDSPIKLEFNSFLKKKTVLANCFKLKNTNISISHDLTPKQREENKILRKYLNQAKQDKNKRCYIKQNKLYVNNTSYTIEKLLELEHTDKDFEDRPVSAPATPTLSLIPEHQVEVREVKQFQTTKTGTIKRKPKNSDKIRLRSTKD